LIQYCLNISSAMVVLNGWDFGLGSRLWYILWPRDNKAEFWPMFVSDVTVLRFTKLGVITWSLSQKRKLLLFWCFVLNLIAYYRGWVMEWANEANHECTCSWILLSQIRIDPFTHKEKQHNTWILSQPH